MSDDVDTAVESGDPVEEAAAASPSSVPADCKARLVDEGWECLRCALAWDEGDARPCCEPLTFKRLLKTVDVVADEYEVDQLALRLSGLRQFRYQPRLKLAQEIRSLRRLILQRMEKEQ